jgi:hypothetical protein
MNGRKKSVANRKIMQSALNAGLNVGTDQRGRLMTMKVEETDQVEYVEKQHRLLLEFFHINNIPTHACVSICVTFLFDFLSSIGVSDEAVVEFHDAFNKVAGLNGSLERIIVEENGTKS